MIIKLVVLFLSLSLLQYRHITTETIWSTDKYAAFTSLVYGDGFYYCAFREASAHRSIVTDSTTWGRIIILRSSDRKNWDIFYIIKEENADLRDPKLSFMPSGDLHLIYCMRKIDSSELGAPISCCISWNKNGVQTKKQYIHIDDYFGRKQWLWGINWHNDMAYGFMYGSDFLLLSSNDGTNFKILSNLKPLGEKPSEATLVFRNDTAIAVARSKGDSGLLGKAIYPYKEWNWKRLPIKLGGPSLAILPNGKLLLGSRNYQDEIGKTSLYIIDNDNLEKLVTLPSTSDSSYPSFVIDDNRVYVSYYTCFKDKCNINLSELIID